MNLNSNVSNTLGSPGGIGRAAFTSNLISNAYVARPTDPIYNADGSYFTDPNVFQYINPYAVSQTVVNQSGANNLFGSLRADLELIKGLTASGFGSWRKTNGYSGYYLPAASTVAYAIDNKGIANINNNRADATPESPAGVVRKDSVTVYRQSNSNGLTALSISGIPVLVAPDMLINVANTTTAITLMPTASAGTIGYRAGISGDWTTISSGAKSASINIGGPGTTTIIQILTTAQDPGVTTPYKISVIRPADGNVELGSLFVNGVAVDLPATNDQSIGFYVEADINSASIVASAKSATSTVAVLPGSTLLLGNHGSVTNATIRVSAQNKTWQDYYLDVHRKNAYLKSITFDQPYEPGFLWSDFGPYTLRIPGIYSLTITPTLFYDAVYPMELYVDGIYIEPLNDGVPTTFSLPIEVNSTIEIKVHSGDGYSTYTFLATD